MSVEPNTCFDWGIDPTRGRGIGIGIDRHWHRVQVWCAGRPRPRPAQPESRAGPASPPPLFSKKA